MSISEFHAIVFKCAVQARNDRPGHRPVLPLVAGEAHAAPRLGNAVLISVSLAGYIHAKVLVEALRRVARGLTRPMRISAMETMSSVDVGGFVIHYSHLDHSASHHVELSIVSAGGERFLY